MTHRSLLVVNRGARAGDADLEPALDILRRDGPVDVRAVEGTGDVAAQVDAACTPDIDRLVIAGGDGTVNAAVPAAMRRRVPIGILPIGTANDFARTLQVPAHIEAAAAVIVAGHTRRIDVGRVNGVFFLNAAGLGFSTALKAELSPALKRWWGPLAYPIGVLARWRRHRPFTVLIEGDTPLRARAIQVTVANGRYYGGGMAAHEEAHIDDGLLDIVILLPRSLWRYALSAASIRRGTYEKAPVITMRTHFLRLTTRRPRQVATDGEITTATPAEFQVLKGAIDVFAPAELEA
jgi:YegS/Rv2252/BmrU family lipid kinase